MNKATKVLVIQFLFFAVIFLAARYIIAHFELLTGIWIPVVSGIITIVLVPQFKVFKIDGKDTVFVAWLFSKKGTPVNWL
ncbi:hypothetical protein SAMN02927937_00219 [Paenimyroides aquimaris]|uniref:Uncharacterized protein n=1 Tax=Paenimyroides marinum TaxID=1159016 RepID=A0A1H6J776_9FLAO|nr:hypothetical protein [Paenimyroides aquimaris]SEH56551.1 hypothetical protein SAMN02927937_00219 [Paenimyroides aquimaris]